MTAALIVSYLILAVVIVVDLVGGIHLRELTGKVETLEYRLGGGDPFPDEDPAMAPRHRRVEDDS